MSIEERLYKLERDNRRLRTLLLAAIMGMATIVTTGFSGESQVPEVIRAESFELVTPSGVVLGKWHLRREAPELMQYSSLRAALIGQSSDEFLTPPNARLLGSMLIVADSTLDGSTILTNVSPGFIVLNKGDLERSAILEVADRAGLEVQGPGGKALLGETKLVNQATGATTSYPASTLTLLDDNGKVRAQLPR